MASCNLVILKPSDIIKDEIYGRTSITNLGDSNMDGLELMILLFAFPYAIYASYKWYISLVEIWPPQRHKAVNLIFGIVPVVSFALIYYTLKVLASFDVVNDGIYIFFYLILGLTWVYLGMIMVFRYFDLSWIDDGLNLNNKSAAIAIVGAYLGLTVIYSGANIGDGPGWWCVIIAGGMGLISWFVLGKIFNKYTHVFERVTVNRDIYCGIRLGAYLLASGLILGRASAGDWTSFFDTIVEFLVGWPAIVLTILAILIERYYIHKDKIIEDRNRNDLIGTLFWSIVYFAIAVVSIVMFPLVENPLYGSSLAGLIGASL
jgi:hypothetical protein